MQKKLKITVDEKVYEGLYRVMGAGKISQFIEKMVRPHVVIDDLDAAYAEMTANGKPEAEALVDIDGLKNKAVADQLTTVSKDRLSNKTGELDPDELRDADLALKIQLDLI